MPVVFASKLTFSDYILSFVIGKHRNGNPWTTDEVIVETGEDKRIVKAYADYVAGHPGLSGDQYIALAPVLIESPMGYNLKDPQVQAPISTTLQSKVGDVTVAEFIAALKSQQ